MQNDDHRVSTSSRPSTSIIKLRWVSAILRIRSLVSGAQRSLSAAFIAEE